MVTAGGFLERSKSHLRHHPPLCVCACTFAPYIVHMASFVRIALAGAGSFAKMEIRAGDDISDLAKRACTEFPSWKLEGGLCAAVPVPRGCRGQR